MTFGAPQALWLLLLLPALCTLVARAEIRSARLARLLAAHRLLPALADRSHLPLRRARAALLLAALALATIALAGPRWGHRWETIPVFGRDVILAIDASRSMLARDVAPDRLTRARLLAHDIVDRLRGDRVGLVAFAGAAFLQAPLTTDHDALLATLAALDAEIIPRGGSNIAAAIDVATRAFDEAAGSDRAMILLGDGEELDGDGAAAARDAARQRIAIHTVGIGSTEGAPILLPGTGKGDSEFVRDESGKVVHSRLDERRLQEIARAANGLYVPLLDGSAAARRIVEDGLGKMNARKIEEHQARRPIERHAWPIASAILLASVALLLPERRRRAAPPPPGPPGHRAGVAVAILLALPASAPDTRAALPSPVDLYRSGKFAEALDGFTREIARHPNAPALHFNAGCAAFKARRFDEATRHFSATLPTRERPLQERAHYNLANTLYERGARTGEPDAKRILWEDAISHYDEALAINPANPKASHNRSLVQRKLEELARQHQREHEREGQRTPQRTKAQDQSGEMSDKSDKSDKSDESDESDAGAEPSRPGQLNRAQACALLDSLRDQEARVWPFERETGGRNSRDW